MNLTRLSGALLAVALPFAVTGVAGASTDTELSLTIATPEGPATTVELECDPAGGTHPNAKDACEELLAVEGDFTELQAQQAPAACTMEYRPMIAVAEGRWKGKRVEWEQQFSNGCTLRTSTGTVFAFGPR
jgi:hypothetical protein